MKTFAKIIMILLLTLSFAQAKAFEKVANSSATKVLISSEKPLSVGNNTLVFHIENAKYKDATLSVKLFMPAMPGMPYMENISDARLLEDGTFQAEVNFAMSGTWQVHIFITPKEGKPVRVKTSLNI